MPLDRPEAVRLLDLTAPVFPADVLPVRDMVASMAGDLRLERDVLLADAHRHDAPAQPDLVGPGLRSLPHWESLEPVLAPAETPAPGEPDPRIARTEIDVRFEDLTGDDFAMVERIFACAGHPMTRAARAAMDAFLATHPRGRHGTVVYDLEVLGLDRAERRAALRFYSGHFDLADEG